MRRLAVALGIVFGGVLVVSAPAGAHPLGNFTTNLAAAIDVGADQVEIRYVLDLAEIPTLRVTQRQDPLAAGYANEECAALAEGLRLTLAGQPLPLAVEAGTATLPVGAAGLPTLRLECRLLAPYEAEGMQDLRFEDTNFADRIGWREVTATGSGADLVASDVPDASITDGLRAYPDDRLASPLDQRTASLTVRPGEGTGRTTAGPVASAESGDGLTGAFTSLVAERNLTVPFALGAVAFALLLGGIHALAPGHGKTVMAAYLIGRDGDRRLAVLLGLTVASTHTMAVLVLGTIVSASETVAPERAYPLLGVVSGLLFASVGVSLLVRALRTRRRRQVALDAAVHELTHLEAPVLVGAGGGEHHHDHEHHEHNGHHHDGHDHDHGHVHHFPEPDRLGWRSIVAPGLAGGLVPSPSALLVYLAGLALGRAWFGVGLVLTYGIGIAGSLVGAGYVLVRARDRLVRTGRVRGLARMERVAVVLPLVTAVLVVGGGLWIAFRAAASA